MKKVLFIILIVLISCKKQAEDAVIENEPIATSEEFFYFDKKTDSILNSAGIERLELITDEDLPILLKGIEKGYFKDSSFCELYKNYKKLEFQSKYKESDLVVKHFSKDIELYNFFSISGYKLCPNALMEAKYSSGNPNYKPAESYQTAKIDPCIIAKDFIESDLKNPSTADFSTFDCSKEQNSDGSYTILRKVTAENSLGVEKKYVYKVRFGFLGGNEVNIKDWKLIGIQSEEYKQ